LGECPLTEFLARQGARGQAAREWHARLHQAADLSARKAAGQHLLRCLIGFIEREMG
jgi:hypothetical protein